MKRIISLILALMLVLSLLAGCGAPEQHSPGETTTVPTLHPKMDWEAAKKLHYSYNPETNFIDVLKSEADMRGLQQLADQYLTKYNDEV